MASRHTYERIGRGYATTRREDPRIAAVIHRALVGARTVVNVGAGSGNYEPQDRSVVAVEPAWEMIRQRAGRRGRVIRGLAENLPFPSGSFDASMAVLTLHHWRDLARGLAELRRVSRRQVVFLFDAAVTGTFWALAYWPEAADVPTERHAPDVAQVAGHLDVRDVQHVEVPIDCSDGFGAAFWGRPEAYLDPAVQAGMSWLAQLPEDDRRRGAQRLSADLASGEWDRRFGHLRHLDRLDVGYRLVVAGD